jgi:hypothetical protein
MNRLGRPSGHNTASSYTGGSVSSKNELDSREQVDYDVRDANLYNLGLQDGTHVAYDHEDTTQGAIHSFQDEKGNWWTYSFDEQGSGTAKALGSGRAIAEMFDRRRSVVSNESRSSQGFYYFIRQILISNLALVNAGPRHAKHAHRNRLSEDHDHTAETSYVKHQKSLPTVPSNSLIDSQSLGPQSHHSGDSDNNSLESKPHQEDDSDSEKFILGNPTNVFHPSDQITSQNGNESGHVENLRSADPNDTGSSRPFISFVNLASRLYTNQLQRNAGRTRLSVPLTGEFNNLHSATSLVEAASQSMSRQSRMALEAFALESRRRMQSNPEAERFRWNDYIRLENSGLLPSRPPRNNNSSCKSKLDCRKMSKKLAKFYLYRAYFLFDL